MSRYDRPTFDPAGKYVARRGFTFNGRSYATGDKFDWRHIACSARKLKYLFEGGYLLLDAPKAEEKKYDAPKAAKKPAKKKPAKKIVEEKSKVEDAPVETKDEADYDIEKFLTDQD